jgi:hypothetical protein
VSCSPTKACTPAPKEEALDWAKRCPLPEGAVLDIYQIFEPATDFPPELRPKSAKP